MTELKQGSVVTVVTYPVDGGLGGHVFRFGELVVVEYVAGFGEIRAVNDDGLVQHLSRHEYVVGYASVTLARARAERALAAVREGETDPTDVESLIADLFHLVDSDPERFDPDIESDRDSAHENVLERAHLHWEMERDA